MPDLARRPVQTDSTACVQQQQRDLQKELDSLISDGFSAESVEGLRPREAATAMSAALYAPLLRQLIGAYDAAVGTRICFFSVAICYSNGTQILLATIVSFDVKLANIKYLGNLCWGCLIRSCC